MKSHFIILGLSLVSALTDFARDNIRANFGVDRFVTIEEGVLSEEVIQALDELSLDQFGYAEGKHHIRISPQGVEKLIAEGIAFEDHTEEFLSSVETNLNDNDFVCSEGSVACAAKSKDDFYDSYHTMATYHQRIENLAAANPGLARVETLGLSFEEKEQKMIWVGDDGEKPLIFYFCAIHAREWLTPLFCTHLAETLLDPASAEGRNLLKAYSFAIIPVANPDGFQYTHDVDNFWRKTRKPNDSSRCVGTDPNRNWGFGWGGVGSSSNPCSDIYKGTAPFDQECVMNIKNFVDEHQDRLIHINDVHSYGGYYLNPWGFTEEAPPADDFAKMLATNQVLFDAIRATSGLRFKVGPASTTIYPASGGSMDYFYGDLGIVYSGVYEARSGGKSGYDGFQPPVSNIKPSNEELFAGTYALADKIYELELCSDAENTNIFRGIGAEEESCENLLNFCSRSAVVRQRCAASCRECSLESIELETRSVAFFLPSGGQTADEENVPEDTSESNNSNAQVIFGSILIVFGIMASIFVAFKVSRDTAEPKQAASKPPLPIETFAYTYP